MRPFLVLKYNQYFLNFLLIFIVFNSSFLYCFSIFAYSLGRKYCHFIVTSQYRCSRSCMYDKLEFVNIILHFYMKSQYDLVQIILMQ